MPTDVIEGFRLSPQQRRLWTLGGGDAETPFRVQCAVDVDGALDEAALTAAVGDAVARHEILRTTFHLPAGLKIPNQVIHDLLQPRWTRRDLGSLDGAEGRAALEEALEASRRRPLDVEAGPLLDVALLRLGDRRHVLAFTVPALIGDRAALLNLVDEVAGFYAARLGAGEAGAEALQYADVAEWQNELLVAEETAEGIDFWRTADLETATALELPDVTPAVESFEPALAPVPLPAAVGDGLAAAARRLGHGPEDLLLAVWLALLGRLAGGGRVGVGAYAAGRKYQELRDALGPFSRYLPVTAEVADAAPFPAFVDSVAGARREGLEREEYFTWDLHPAAEEGHVPAFPATFDFAPRGRHVEAAGLRFAPRVDHRVGERFAVELAGSDDGGSLSARLRYDRRRVGDAAARRLAARLGAHLASVAGAPAARLGALDALAPEERRRFLVEVNRTSLDLPAGATLDRLFTDSAAARPRAPAVLAEDGELSYGELDRRAAELAGRLQRAGAGPERPVGLCLSPGLRRAVGVVAAVKAGAPFLPLDTANPAQRLRWMLDESRPAALVADDGGAAALPDVGLPVLSADGDGDAGPPTAAPSAASPVGPDHLAYLIYTSGSTGHPKAVAVSHRAVVNRILWGQRVYPLDGDDRVLHTAAFGFDFAVWEILAPLLTGAALVVPRPGGYQDSGYLVELIRRRGVTVAHFVPSMLQLFLHEPEVAECDSLRLLFSGGEALPADLAELALERLPGAALYNQYGPTEATVDATFHRCTSGSLDGGVPIGAPIANMRVYVTNRALQPQPAGVAGELLLGGTGLARGYLRRPGATSGAFVPDPFAETPGERLYRTGDLARFRRDGDLVFLGRIDDQVKVRGTRIELGEIERCLVSHPALAEAAAAVREDAPGDVRLVAYAVAADGADAPSVQEMREHLQAQLPEYMVPSAFVVLPALPRTASGKLDRGALPAPEQGRGDLEQEYVAPRGEAEERMATVWGEVLGVRRVGVHDGFFALGGHSLLAMRLVSRVREAFATEISLRTVFEAPTVAAMTAALETAPEPSAPELPPVEPVSRERPLPLSFGQQRLWLLDQLTPGDPVYNIPHVLRLQGELEVGVFCRALGEVVRRHEILRTTFVTVAGDPVQSIHPPRSLRPPRVDLTGLPPARREPEARRLAGAEARRGFDLAAGPLLRICLTQLAADDLVASFTFHHIVSDGWSTGILVREVTALYQAWRSGAPSPLPELPVQYADFAVWQRRQMGGGVLEEQLQFWRRELSPPLPVLQLPLDRPRPELYDFSGDTVVHPLPDAVHRAVQDLGSDHRATLFMTLLAAWNVLLARYSGQRDLLVGTPVAGRERPEVEGLIGFFVNTLALRADLSGDPGFATVVERVRRTSLAAFGHSSLPFDRLVEELQPDRRLNRTPIFQVAFTVINRDESPVRLPELSISAFPAQAQVAKFDLTLTGVERRDGLTLEIDYSTQLFDRTTAERMLRQLETLLAAAAADPRLPISRLPLLRDEERRQVVEEWNRTTSEYPRGAVVHELFEAVAAQRPEAPAVDYGDGAITYGELKTAAERLARRLTGLGVEPGTLVGLAVERSPLAVVAMLAILEAGGAYLPLDASYPPERVAFMLTDAGVPLVLAEPSLSHLLPADGDWLVVDPTPLVAATGEGEEDPGVEPPRVDPRAPAYVIYTSGSTGRPKGVVVPHRAVVRLVRDTDYVELGADDRVAQASNTSFDAATFEIWGALLNGALLVGVDKDTALEPERLAEHLRRHRVTTLFLTTALFNQVVRARSDAFASLDHLLFGGEAVDPRWVRRCLQEGAPGRLLHVYGPTESTTYSSWHRVREVPPGATTVPIGMPIANTTIHVVDPAFTPLPPGIPGELVIGGDGLAHGYHRRPARTASVFVPDPFSGRPGSRLYRTGDLVRRRADGAIEFVGRIDQQVKVRGFRIELGEIETALNARQEIADSVVVVRRDEGGDKSLVAYLVPAAGSIVVLDDVRAALRRRLPEYMVPPLLVPLDELPLTPNGKVDRTALPDPADLRERPVSEPATGDPIAEVVSTLWCKVLDLDRVGPDDDFFALGGHSLLATRLISRLRETFDVDVPLRSLFESPTVAGVTAAVEEALRAESGLQAPPLEPVPRDRPLPPSFAQQRLWFLDQLVPGGIFYNIPVANRLRGKMHVGALRWALAGVVARHEVLRSRFVSLDGEPAVAVVAPGPVSLPTIDLSGLPADRREAEARRLAAADARRPFQLDRAPLWRFSVLRLEREEWMLLTCIHHILADGWSLGLLFGELVELYRERLWGWQAELDELPVQYGDYAAWQRRWLSGDVLEAQIGFWRRRLAGAPSRLELATDRPRPPVQTFRGAIRNWSLDADASASLRSFGRATDSTLFMVLLAAYKALLHRYSGQRKIVVGTPIANRNRSETEVLIGLFANTLALATEVRGEAGFGDLVASVRDVALSAYAHQDMPFEKLVEELQPERDLTHQPLFQVMFALQNVPLQTLYLPGLDPTPVRSEGEVAKFDLNLIMEEEDDRVRASLQYNVDLFDDTTAERLLHHLGNLLCSAVAAPERPLAELDLLAAAERHQLVRSWNDTARPYPRHQLLHHGFERQVESRQEAVAVLDGERTLTYGEVEAEANRLARLLRGRGVGPGVLVALHLERSLEMVPALLAVLKAGGVYVPLETHLPPARLQWILAHFAIAVVLTQTPRLASLAELELPDLRCVVTLDDAVPEPPAATAWEVLGRRDLAALPALRPEPSTAAGDPAYVIFTSGSTGTPKGVQVCHRPVVNLIDWVNREHGVGPDDRVLFITALSFDLSVYDVFGLLAAGGSVRVASSAELADPERLLAILCREPITFWDSAPAALERLAPFFGTRAFPPAETLRLVFLSGDWIPVKLPARVRRQFPGARVIALGGATEATVWSNAFPVREVDPEWVSIPYGRPIQNARYLVLNQAGQPCPVGVPGDLYIGGEVLCAGYFGDPRQTAEKFVPEPDGGAAGGRLYRTGDRARFFTDGNLQFLGRLDHQVKVRGFRIELGEIETILAEHPSVDGAVVLAREDVPGDKRLVAYAVPRQGRSVEPEELRTHAAHHLPEYMVPSVVFALDAFPLTPSGKLDRAALPAPERFADGALRVAPRDVLETDLAQQWEAVLGQRPVGIHENFFELGGNSLLAVQLIARVRQVTGQELPLATLFQAPTVAELAAALRRAGRPEGAVSPLVAIQPLGDRPAFFCVHGIGGEVLSYADLARHLGDDQPFYGLQATALTEVEGETSLPDMAGSYLDALREVQPEGPYRLGGYSYGGVVAYEMARQLRREGEGVALLAILDGFAPQVSRRGAGRSEVLMLAGLAREMARRAGIELDLPHDEVRRMERREAIEKVLAMLKSQHLLPPEVDEEWVRRLLSGIRSREAALESYQVESYEGAITLFRSTEIEAETAAAWREQGVDVTDPAAGWDELCERLRIRRIPGHHVTLLQSPYVESLARELRDALDAAATVAGRDRRPQRAGA